MGDRKRLRVGEPEELPIKRRSAGIAYGGLGTGASSLPQQTLEPISPSDTSMEDFNSIPSSQETIKTVEGKLYDHCKRMYLGTREPLLTSQI